jgi:hypothetical protein
MSGFLIARPMATAWRWPPESVPTGRRGSGMVIRSRASVASVSSSIRRSLGIENQPHFVMVSSSPRNTLLGTSSELASARSW